MDDIVDANSEQKQEAPTLFTGAVLERQDTSGNFIREGDVVLWTTKDSTESVVCQVIWSGHKSAFCLRELNGFDAFCEYSFMRDGEYAILGSGRDNPGLLDSWMALGLRGTAPRGFLPDHAEWCFPLAILNACIGAGINKAQDPRLLEQLAMIGECPKWGVCIEEEAVIATASEWFHVRFIPASLEDVSEVGGIVTAKLGEKCFHAAACFMHGGHAYLVNSGLSSFFAVHPMGDIPRSDRPEDHRDYMLLRE